MGVPGDLAATFASAMRRLEPFERSPSIAVAVSGGADSMALAILARDWVARNGGRILALVVDHGLRAESAIEANQTIERLEAAGIPAKLLTLTALHRGPALAERARIMRYQVLSDACRDAGYLHLLLGHHAGDQAETLAMRVLSGSRTAGLAGMAALAETGDLRLLRPLLAVDPGLLKQFLVTHGIAWVEDPSNRDLRALRPRLRHLLAAHARPDTTAALTRAAAAAGRSRADDEAGIARELGERAAIRPEGFALLTPGRISPGALASLIRTIGGAAYPPNAEDVARLAADLRPATLAGVRIMSAGRLGKGVLITREERSVAEPVAAGHDVIWDRRFRLIARQGVPAGATLGKLGDDATRFRAASNLPAAVLRTLPAVRVGKVLAAVPHLNYADSGVGVELTVLFAPPAPAAGAVFVPAL